LAAKTIFVMLYSGALEATGRWLRPDQVTRMTDMQSRKTSEQDRLNWTMESLKPTRGATQGRWYAQNTREPIRDETLRNGLLQVNAVMERKDLATTSSKPRYALKQEFADLFDPDVSGEKLEAKILHWQAQNLSAGALARVQLVRRAVVATDDGIVISFPNGETRRMAPGLSSVISKAVIEVFAKEFLEKPGVLWLSESRNKVVARDDDLASAIGLKIKPEQSLPAIILVDLGSVDPILIFVEVVATDGPINEARQAALLKMTTEAGFREEHVAFVTAYLDRDKSVFRRTFSSLAWRSFVWCASEPQCIVILNRGIAGKSKRLHELMWISDQLCTK
jgi:hypothetical protein